MTWRGRVHQSKKRHTSSSTYINSAPQLFELCVLLREFLLDLRHLLLKLIVNVANSLPLAHERGIRGFERFALDFDAVELLGDGFELRHVEHHLIRSLLLQRSELLFEDSNVVQSRLCELFRRVCEPFFEVANALLVALLSSGKLHDGMAKDFVGGRQKCVVAWCRTRDVPPKQRKLVAPRHHNFYHSLRTYR